mmetsp:Transcript_38984/g.93820  ORF Transcript_38984/g.93820 Transcript_38984/m.93820 type:complete len:232 (-) Transcript_38984:955-1650(-)
MHQRTGQGDARRRGLRPGRQGQARSRRVHPLGRMAHEARTRASHAPEGGYPAHGRTHQPPRRHQRRLGQEVPQLPHQRHRHHCVARLRPSQRLLYQHSADRQPQTSHVQGQPRRVREDKAQRPRILLLHRVEAQVPIPPAGSHRGSQVQGKGAHENVQVHLHLPRQRHAHPLRYLRPGVTELPRRLRRRERRRKVHHDQAPRRRDRAADGIRVEAPQRAYRICRPARLPPH